MTEAKQVPMHSEPTIHSIMAELKEHLANELKNLAFVERPMCAKQAADYLLIHENTLYRRMKTGQIPARVIHRTGGSVYFFPSELKDYIKKS
jgi:predicted DNA-binding transcriptional regulator AlpA